MTIMQQVKQAGFDLDLIQVVYYLQIFCKVFNLSLNDVLKSSENQELFLLYIASVHN